MANKTTETAPAAALELRQAIVAAKGGRRNAPIPKDLQKRSVEMLETGKLRGSSARETAAMLGIHEITLLGWQRKSKPAFVRARVVVEKREKPETAIPVATRSLRVTLIDGLDVASLAALLERLS